MGMSAGGHRGVKSEINITPLVDVVLVLLIIFMVVTPMLQRGKDVHLPKATSFKERPSDADPLILSITKDKSLYLERVPSHAMRRAARRRPTSARGFAFSDTPLLFPQTRPDCTSTRKTAYIPQAIHPHPRPTTPLNANCSCFGHFRLAARNASASPTPATAMKWFSPGAFTRQNTHVRLVANRVTMYRPTLTLTASPSAVRTRW